MKQSKLVLAPLPRSATAARAWSDATLADWGCGALEEPARVVVTELVSNVVRHAPGDLELALVNRDGAVRVEVSDHAGGRVEIAPAADFGSSGRGLRLVERLTDGWGVDYRSDGKTVWAEWRDVSAPGR